MASLETSRYPCGIAMRRFETCLDFMSSRSLTCLPLLVCRLLVARCSHLFSHGAEEVVALLTAENLLILMAKNPQTDTSITSDEPSRTATIVARQPSRAPMSRLLRIQQVVDCPAALVVSPTILQLVAVVHHGPAVENSDRVLRLFELFLRKGARVSALHDNHNHTHSKSRVLGEQSVHLDVLRSCP